MKCAIIQPSYIPWRGYFHQIQKADVFVFYDDVTYDDDGWRNRNQIKTAQGKRWLTVPVLSKGCHANHTPIRDIMIRGDQPWNRKHWAMIEQSYSKAPFFQEAAALLRPFYEKQHAALADLTIGMTRAIADRLGLGSRRYLRSSELKAEGAKTERLLSVLRQVGADHYISGPSARDYLDEALLRSNGIGVEYMEYDYPPYPQLHGDFDGFVSTVDLLVMTGPRAPEFIWGKRS